MKKSYSNYLKTSLALITGWLGAGFLLLLLALVTQTAFAADPLILNCQVSTKYTADLSKVYSNEELEKWQFSVRVAISEAGDAIVSRCGLSLIAESITCDTYEMNLVRSDSNTGITKLYHFDSQFNVQLLKGGAGTFIEDNGRGGIAHGECR